MTERLPRGRSNSDGDIPSSYRNIHGTDQTEGEGPGRRWGRQMARIAHHSVQLERSTSPDESHKNENIVDAELVQDSGQMPPLEKNSLVAPHEPYLPPHDIRVAVGYKVRQEDADGVEYIKKARQGEITESRPGELEDTIKHLRDRISFWKNLSDDKKQIYALSAGMSIDVLDNHFNTFLQNAVEQP